MVQNYLLELKEFQETHTHTSWWYRHHSGHTHVTSFITATLSINPDSVVSIALEVGQGGTGCCCIAHIVPHQ